MADSPINNYIIGNYQLTGKKLGKGSYSTVREGKSLINSRRYALKIVNIETDNYIKKHYRREFDILKLLNHENIVKVYETIESEKRFILVLELVPNNLCDFVRNQKKGKLDEATSCIFFRQISSALAFLHGRGIVHRDVKLENLLLDTRTNKLKLTDFGLSNFWDKKTSLTQICGSPEYSAPELHVGKPYGCEIDIWALGVCLFAMTVGRLPFEVDSKKPTDSKHRRELFFAETSKSINTRKHQLAMNSTTPAFKDLVSKLLNPDQSERIKLSEVEKHDWVVLNKVDISRVRIVSNRPPEAALASMMPYKPGSAHVRDMAQRNFPRPITEAMPNRYTLLKSTLKSRMERVQN